ncbi:MAG: universal stress protein [Kiloniellales bacterium]|nr:universal stress protein [Kiloniellales bacterium]MDJ0968561.1 universal stress protein [Kiloniellales bacterium]
MLKKILVAIDGSQPSQRALDMGAQIAEKFDAVLVLIYVIRDMQLPESLRQMAEVELVQESRLTTLQKIGQTILAEAATRAKKQGAKDVRNEVRPGDPAGAILRYVAENGVDLIVMGSRGLGDVESMLLGSVSRKVSNLAKVGCLTVR